MVTEFGYQRLKTLKTCVKYRRIDRIHASAKLDFRQAPQIETASGSSCPGPARRCVSVATSPIGNDPAARDAPLLAAFSVLRRGQRTIRGPSIRRSNRRAMDACTRISIRLRAAGKLRSESLRCRGSPKALFYLDGKDDRPSPVRTRRNAFTQQMGLAGPLL